MYPINKLTHTKIQRELRESLWSVDSILRSLNITKQVTPEELHKRIIEDLKNMKFEIKYDRRLCNAHGNQSVPAFTKFNTSNRTDGGTIMLNPDCSVSERLESLYHEYMHIKDHSLPLSSTHAVTFENKVIFYKFFTDIDRLLVVNQDIYKNILDDLSKRNFKIVYDKDLKFPAFTKFNTPNRTKDGTISLSTNFSTNEKLEALYHEYVSIIDYALPIYEMYKVSPEYKVIVDKSYQDMVEFQADMRAYTLLMPPDEMRLCLLRNNYNIAAVLKKYGYMEKSAVLQWIAIISGIPCHFAWVMYEKDNNNNIVRGLIHDNCYYDHKTDPQPFGIETVLDTNDSAAALAIKKGKSIDKKSIIGGKEYYCYAYYESNQSKEIRSNTTPVSVTIYYDRLLVIGWEKAVYDTIQYFSKLVRGDSL
jgi:hypothetical protein